MPGPHDRRTDLRAKARQASGLQDDAGKDQRDRYGKRQAPAPEAFTTLKNEHDIVLATMGRMSMEKNQAALIEALALLRKQDGTEGGGAQGLSIGLAIVGSRGLGAAPRAGADGRRPPASGWNSR